MKKFLAVFSFFLLSGLGYFWFSLPTEKTFDECITTAHYKVNVCRKGSDFAKYSQISRYMVAAVVAAEDTRFWNHNGFDLVELENSLRLNVEKGQMLRGGSTISQQLSKNLFLSFDKNVFRKLHEILITWRIEKILSKKEIMELYLNSIEFGDKIYGIKNASRYYFKKSPHALNPLESAFLASILPNPKKYSQSRHRDQLSRFLSGRMRKILLLMRLNAAISMDQYQLHIAQAPYLFRPESMVNPSNLASETLSTEDQIQNIDLNVIEEIEKEQIEP